MRIAGMDMKASFNAISTGRLEVSKAEILKTIEN